ncbi:MAG: hypothetical protein ACKOXG_06520 [Arenimonas sp.]
MIRCLILAFVSAVKNGCSSTAIHTTASTAMERCARARSVEVVSGAIGRDSRVSVMCIGVAP